MSKKTEAIVFIAIGLALANVADRMFGLSRMFGGTSVAA